LAVENDFFNSIDSEEGCEIKERAGLDMAQDRRARTLDLSQENLSSHILRPNLGWPNALVRHH
jgi:hypothetical protein